MWARASSRIVGLVAEVVVRFETKADAYGFLSESRRVASSLLWEVKVEPADDAWLVRVPFEVYRVDMDSSAVDRFHGVVLTSPG